MSDAIKFDETKEDLLAFIHRDSEVVYSKDFDSALPVIYSELFLVRPRRGRSDSKSLIAAAFCCACPEITKKMQEYRRKCEAKR
jgi:hypothetical protein